MGGLVCFLVEGLEGVRGPLTLLSFLYLFPTKVSTRDVMGKMIASRDNRPIVNTAIGTTNDGRNIIASLSNGFDVSTTPSTALAVACVNVRSGAIGTRTNGALAVALGSSSGILGSIIIVNCNIRGGDSLANTITSVGDSSVGNLSTASTNTTLRNGTTNMRVVGSNNPNRTTSVHVHNCSSGDNGVNPLLVISNLGISGVRCLSPSVVRDVRMLGSTTSTTVCNTRTNGNIIVVAAGANTTGNNGTRVSCDDGFAVRSLKGETSVFSTPRCVRCRGCLNSVSSTLLRGGNCGKRGAG